MPLAAGRAVSPVHSSVTSRNREETAGVSMGTMRPPAILSDPTPEITPTSSLPVARHRAQRILDPRLDHARRELWRAHQRGALSEEEFAAALYRLEFAPRRMGRVLDSRT